MQTISNFLSNKELNHLKKICKFETTGERVNLDVPLFQSSPYLHLKYKNDSIFMDICDKILNTVKLVCNKTIEIDKLWINATRPESRYEWHKHDEYIIPTIILYIDGCENNGTYFKINNTVLQVQIAHNNTLLVFDGKQFFHQTPNWNGKERYTLAADFICLYDNQKTIDFLL